MDVRRRRPKTFADLAQVQAPARPHPGRTVTTPAPKTNRPSWSLPHAQTERPGSQAMPRPPALFPTGACPRPSPNSAASKPSSSCPHQPDALPHRPAVKNRPLPHRPERPAHRAPRSLPHHVTASPTVTTDPARQPLRGPRQTRPRSACTRQTPRADGSTGHATSRTRRPSASRGCRATKPRGTTATHDRRYLARPAECSPDVRHTQRCRNGQ